MDKDTIFLFIVILLFVILGGGLYYFFVYQNSYCYTQIDNNRISEIVSNDDMKYEYTLTAYNKNGKATEVSFKTTRQLKDDAFLKLKVMITRGVVSWEEIQYNELPKSVQEKYEK